MLAAALVALLVAALAAALASRPRRIPPPLVAPLADRRWRPVHDRIVARADRELAAGRACHGEALLRRAIDLARTAEPGAEIEAATRLVGAPTSRARDRTIASLSLSRVAICVDLECALYRWHDGIARYEPFAALSDRWYLLAPAAWVADPALHESLEALADAILADANARRAESAAADPSFVGLRRLRAHAMSAADVLATPWKTALAHSSWSRSAGYLVDDPRTFVPCRPSELVPLVALSLVVADQLSPAAAAAHLVAHGLDEPAADRLTRDPAREIENALSFYLHR